MSKHKGRPNVIGLNSKLGIVSKRVILWATFILIFTTALTGHTSTIKGQPSAQILETLDSDYQELSHQYFQQLSRSTKKYHSTKALYTAVHSSIDSLQRNQIIRNNVKLVAQSASMTELSYLLETLYTSNDTATIRDITLIINREDDTTKVSLNYFLLAKYYFERGNWQGVQGALSKVDAKELTPGDAQYYSLLMGYSLQGSKKHRKSVTHYKKIPRSSPYFAHAKLNEGTAYLRQGWWTEAHIEFDNAISALLEAKDTSDFANRILVVLGFSQIHYEFYRDARKTLRKVDLDSAYANKAMMGLGIAAAHQKDFASALNLFELLLQKHPRDKNVDEAYLLVPYGYEELNDTASASINYQRAIQYYKARIAELKKASLRLDSSSEAQLTSTIEQLNLDAKELYNNPDLIPSYLLNNYSNLLSMQQSQNSHKTSSAVNNLLAKYKYQIKTLITQSIQVRETALNSYLSQAQFGVAKLYDQ